MPAEYPLMGSSPASDTDSLTAGPEMNYDTTDMLTLTSPSSPDERKALRDLPRRPGLGMIHDVYRAPRNGQGPPPAEEAKRLLNYDSATKLEAELKAGETVYLLSFVSYDEILEWLETGNDALRHKLDAVDNTILFELYEDFERPGRMRQYIERGKDFVCVSPATWELLMDWFGGGPGTARKCMNVNGRVLIDVRGVEVKVKRSSRPTKFMRFVLSTYDAVSTLKRLVVEAWKKQFGNDFIETSYRVWDYYNDKCGARMHPDSAQLATFRITEGQSIMFEEPDPVSGEFRWDPETGEDRSSTASSSNLYGPSDSLYSVGSSSAGFTDYRGTKRSANVVVSTRRPSIPGAVGLSNLGNTCFMNSTLQCLSNIWPLRDRFVRDEYRADINERNVLGTGGKLANSFGDLMKLLWGNGGDIVSPSGFKSVMAEFKPEFSGYQQHDSQELLSFLLDGLHEDLNRVKVKPVTEPVEPNGRSDAEVARDSCRVHRMRNDSFVNDLFEGFYKSTVVCPDCSKVSVTFDPFTMVQLPVSRPRQAKTIALTVSVLEESTGLPSRAKPCTVRIPLDGYMREAKASACAMESSSSNGGGGKHADDFIMASIYRERVDKVYTEFDKPDKYTLPDELFAFEDKNARKLRLLSELIANGSWYRPLIKCEEDDDEFMKDFECIEKPVSSVSTTTTAQPPPSSPGSCVFRAGEVYIGTLELRKYRIRMHVEHVSEVGPYMAGLGQQVRCALDVSPINMYSHYDRKEGSEEAAYQMQAFVPLVSSTGECMMTFEQTRFLGSFGSFFGDFANFTADSPPLMLTGKCDAHYGFFSGSVEEKQSPNRRGMYYSSSYSYSKAFAMIRVDETLRQEIRPALDWLKAPPSFGPRVPPPASCLSVVTLVHRRLSRAVGQPSVFTIPGNATPKDLYAIVVARMTARGQKRLNRMEEDYNADPFGLHGTFRLLLRLSGGSQPIVLHPEDDSTVLYAIMDEAVPKLSVEADWDPALALEEESRAGVALFGALYPDDAHGEDSHSGTRLYDCFDMFSEQEKLTSTETWYCSNCKDHKEAFKRMELWQLPPVLIIHLKRFSQSQSSYLVDKDDTEVDFPLEGLDLSDRVRSPDAAAQTGECMYDLVAVSHHYGGLGGGHYVAHARNEADGLWYEFDDSSVRFLGTSATAATKVKGGSAYVLMYVRRSLTSSKWSGNNIVEHRSLATDQESISPDNDTDFGVV